MQIEHMTNVTVLEIKGAPALDSIRVFLQDFGGSGRIIVECYGQAWCAFFGSLGNATLVNFVTTVHAEYLANSLQSPSDHYVVKHRQKHAWGYLLRVTEAVQAALRIQATP